jgi:hypothetical protein
MGIMVGMTLIGPVALRAQRGPGAAAGVTLIRAGEVSA